MYLQAAPKPAHASPGALPRSRLTSYPSRSTPLVFPAPSGRVRVPALPTEILRLIIERIPFAKDFIGPGQYLHIDPAKKEAYEQRVRTALRMCCLANKTLLEAARAVLYSDVDLSVFLTGDVSGRESEDNRRRSGRRVIALHRWPALHHAVRKVRLCSPRPRHPDSPPYADALMKLLKLFKRMDTLEVVFPPGPDAFTLATALGACPPLHTLDVVATVYPGEVAAVWGFVASQPSIKSLSLTIKSSQNLGLSSSLLPATFELSSLHIDAHLLTQSALNFLTLNSICTLHTLTLYPGATPDDEVSLAHLSRLTHLTLLRDEVAVPSKSLFGIPHLPLRNFYQIDKISSTHVLRLLMSLPATCDDVCCPLPSASDLLLFLASDHLPVIRKLWFRDRSNAFWSPEEQIVVARACERRGLRLVMPEPRDEAQYLEQLEFIKRMRPSVVGRRDVQPTLYELEWFAS